MKDELDDLTECDAIIDAPDRDYKRESKDRIRAILTRVFTGVRADVRKEWVQSHSPALGLRLHAAIEEGRISDIDQLLSDFALEGRRFVLHERQFGRLKPIYAATELERCKDFIRSRRWDGGAEHDAMIAMIADGERIKVIGFWKIETDRREITRSEIRVFQKPNTWSRPGTWESQFISDAEVRDAEESAARAASPPARDAYNTDFPNGIRPS